MLELLLIFIVGIYNSRVTKPIYKTKLLIMTSQTEKLTLKIYFIFSFYFFELVTRWKKIFNIVLELVTRDFFKKTKF